MTAVRTVLGVDERTGAVHFGGSVPEGTYVRLMKASPAAASCTTRR